ncbi:MAG TPA: hypothetical protein VH851_13195 [Candidatus Binatia bacterium]
MKQTAYLWSGIVICAVLIVLVLFKINSLENTVRLLGEPNGSALSTGQNSVKLAQADAKAAKELAPGLGEFMTTIQLHAGKLWFAAQAANWDLAKYELDELKETMEAAKGLNEEKNGVKISNVLDSVLQTQVAGLEKTMESKSQSAFKKSYDETLSACNGCHTEAGYKFIHIVRPTAPPVTNQKW